MRRIAVLTVAAVLGSCSTGMQRVSSTWDGLSVPRCTDSYLPVVGDTFIGGLAFGMGVAASDGAGDTYDMLALAGIVIGVVFAIDAGVGTGAVLQCKAAQAKAKFRGSIEQTASRTKEPSRTASAAAGQVPPTAARGYFCASSPTVAAASLCVRDSATCVQARSAALVGVADLGACTPAAAVFCFPSTGGDAATRCASSAEACAAQRDAAAAGAPDAATIGSCVEMK